MAIFLALVTSAMAPVASLHADDRAITPDEVIVRSKSGGRLVQKGTIVDFNGRELVLRVGRGLEQTYPAEDVVAVTTPRSEHHVRGAAALQAGRFDEAARELEFAVGAERRPWVRRNVLALLVRAARARGQGRTARIRFELLVKSDPHTRDFPLIPLAWANEPLDAATAEEARVLLVHELEAMRLVGASLLIGRPGEATEVDRVLRRLTSSVDDRVRHLALAQQWRLRLGGRLTEHEVTGWQRRFDEMPEELRAGPSYVLGRGLALVGQLDRAAMALLWAPLVDDHDPFLAARSLVEAAEALRRTGQDNRAFTLYRETVSRYGHTPFADEARSAIASMSAPRDDVDARGELDANRPDGETE